MADERDFKGRFAKGNSGGGRSVGATNKAKLFEKLTAEHASEIVASILEDAKNGDGAARKMFMDRYFPVSAMQIQQLEEQMEELREMLETHHESR
jgi:hypothetical protein